MIDALNDFWAGIHAACERSEKKWEQERAKSAVEPLPSPIYDEERRKAEPTASFWAVLLTSGAVAFAAVWFGFRP